MDFDTDIIFKDLLPRLRDEGIDVIMIGGHAVNHYGVTRATQDVDFMITAEDAAEVGRILSSAGFINVYSSDNVMFFSRPSSPLRVDFLKSDRETMDKLLANAVEIDYFGQERIRVPQVQDLLRMKIFSLHQGGYRREYKDFHDIAGIVLENRVDVDGILRSLCEEQGSLELFERLRMHIDELKEKH